MPKTTAFLKDTAADYAIRALASALEAVPVELEATAAGEKPLATTMKGFITAFLSVQSSERQLIESVAKSSGVRVSAYDRTTPRRDPVTQRFHVPLVKVESVGHYGRVSTLFLLGNGYIATWFGPSDGSSQGTSLRPLGIGVTGPTVHAIAINSLSNMLKEFIRVHKYDVANTKPAHPNAPSAPNAAPVPAGSIQHDRHGDAVPHIPNTPGLMSVRHGQLVEAKVATASSAVTVGDYVQAKAEELGLDKSNIRYVLGNLAVASINSTAVANTRYQSLADNALQSLAKKIKKDKEADEKRKKTTEENRPSKRPYGTNDGALEDKKDPFTQEKLTTVYLLGDREVLLNEHSKVVYPIPDLKKVEGEDKA